MTPDHLYGAVDRFATWADTQRGGTEVQTLVARWRKVQEAALSLHIWFMFDNHTFRKIDFGARDALFSQVREAFDTDACGSLFVRDGSGGTVDTLSLSADWTTHKAYHVYDPEIEEWIVHLYNYLEKCDGFQDSLCGRAVGQEDGGAP